MHGDAKGQGLKLVVPVRLNRIKGALTPIKEKLVVRAARLVKFGWTRENEATGIMSTVLCGPCTKQ